jgi:hypothetical protein
MTASKAKKPELPYGTRLLYDTDVLMRHEAQAATNCKALLACCPRCATHLLLVMFLDVELILYPRSLNLLAGPAGT